MAIERKCCNCDFWQQFAKDPNVDPAKDATDYFGECRINPPGPGDGEYLHTFPVTSQECWCGKFAPRVPR